MTQESNKPVEMLACPNPWCGSSEVNVWSRAADERVVACGRCHIVGPTKATEAEAITAWNTRLSSTPTADREAHCSTCGTNVAEVLCATCGKWWADNPPPSDREAVLEEADIERVAAAIYDAPDSQSGDTIGTVIWNSDHLIYETVEGEEIVDTARRASMPVCRDAARAAIRALASTPSTAPADMRGLAGELEAKYLAWKNIGDARILADRKRVEFAEACYAAMPAILSALSRTTPAPVPGEQE